MSDLNGPNPENPGPWREELRDLWPLYLGVVLLIAAMFGAIILIPPIGAK